MALPYLPERSSWPLTGKPALVASAGAIREAVIAATARDASSA